MASPDWPKWEFKDGRKRMTLPIVDTRGNEDGNTTTPKPIRLNSTESSMKKTRSEGEKASTSIYAPSNRRSRKSSKEGGGWMSKEETQREIRARRSIDSRHETLTDTVPEKKSVGVRSIDSSRLESLPDTVPEKKKSALVQSVDSRLETLGDTVPDKKSTVGGRSSIEKKKRSGTPLRALENVKFGEINQKAALFHLPTPLSEMMLMRDESVTREKEAKRRRNDPDEKSEVTVTAVDDPFSKGDEGGASTTPRPAKPRKRSFFFPRKEKKADSLQRRASLDSTVLLFSSPTVLPERSTVERREENAVDWMDKSPLVRKKSLSPFGGARDGLWSADDFMKPVVKKGRTERSEEGRVKVMRRSTEGGTGGKWITPSLQDFRPSSKQSRKSNEAAKEKESTVLVRRESTSVVPPTPMPSEKEGESGGRVAKRTSVDACRLVSPCASDFTPANGRKKSKPRMEYFGEKTEEKKDEKKDEWDKEVKAKPDRHLSWGRLASAIYRKTSMHTEISIGSTVPGEFEEEDVALEREQERMNSITSMKSEKSGEEAKNPVNRFVSSISLATTRGPSTSESVVKDSMEEEEEEEKPHDGFRPSVMDEDSLHDEFEIKDTVQDGAPKALKFTKPSGLGLFRRPVLPHAPVEDRSFSPPPPSRHSSGGSTTSANPRGRRQIGVDYADKLTKQLEKALCLRRTDRTLLKHDNSSVTSIVMNIEEDRSSGWGVSLVSHSRGLVLLPGNTAPPQGSCVRVVLPLQCVLDSVAVAPTVL